MSKNMVAISLGDSLRNLADIVDRASGLEAARTHPSVPNLLVIPVSTTQDVHEFAALLGAEVSVYQNVTGGDVHTYFRVEAGLVALQVAHLGKVTDQ
jgi:hypothetical protein